MESSFLENKYLLISLTFLIYIGAQKLQKVCGLKLLNPILITMCVMMCYLLSFNIDDDTYQEGGRFIEFWLKPAIVALGVPLYKQLSTIRRQMLPLLIAEIAGCVAGLFSVIIIARFLGASQEVVMSLAPKAVTTPIAMEVSSAIGGIPALTAAVVVSTGVFGGIAGFQIIKYSKIKSSIAGGLSIGTAAHAIGTSAAMEQSERYGAYSSLGLTVNGLLTALLAPFLLEIMGLL